MKTPDRIFTQEDDDGVSFSKMFFFDHETGPYKVEYIKASLLKDDKWLADNGLKRVCKKCNGQGKIPHFVEKDGGIYLSHYEPCYDCQRITVSGY